MVPLAQQISSALVLVLWALGVPRTEVPSVETAYGYWSMGQFFRNAETPASRPPDYDLLFEPFASRAPDGSLYIGQLFRALFTEFPQSAGRPAHSEGPPSSPFGDDVDAPPAQFHARRRVVCCFLGEHFSPKGEEIPGSAEDSTLQGILARKAADGPGLSPEGSWKVKNKTERMWGSLELEVMLENLDSPPRESLGDRWQTKKALQVDMAGPFFAFGEFNAGYNTISAQEMKMSGGTGLGLKLAAWDSGEVSFKGGSQVNYFQDPLRPDRVQSDKSRLLFGLECQYAIVGPLKLEYSGSAVPAMSPLESSRISQDIRLLLPLGSNGHFRIGAKRYWDSQPAYRATPDANQIYLGVGLTR
jgi:hypothetical protein